MSSVILMYHRVCERAGARPWFARGTAVTPKAFAAQMRWLTHHFDVVPLRDLLAERNGGPEGPRPRPRAALTFDDGYADLVRHALPVCQELDVTGAVFPVCEHLAEHGRRLWFDAFYDLLQAAIPSSCADDDPRIDGVALSSWVRGEEKEALQRTNPDERPSLLRAIATRLGTPRAQLPALYLSRSDLAQLRRLGWTVGGHGVTHSRFTALSDERLREELARSVSFVSTFGEAQMVLAYPDGAHDARVRELAERAGFKWGLTVSPGPFSHKEEFDPLAVPRYFCRGEGEIPNPALAALVD